MVGNEDMLRFEWVSDPNHFKGQREEFVGPRGPTFPVEGLSPFEIFQKFWDQGIMSTICQETNRYAANFIQRVGSSKWVPTTLNEMWTFFGVMMLQSIVLLPVEREYWTPCLPYLKLGNFHDIIKYYRFILLKKNLHFANNDEHSLRPRSEQKLAKIMPIVDHFNEKCSSLFSLGQEIAIDESLLLWKGRLSFAQVITTKAAGVGIKSFELCESQSGYLWKLKLYAGKKDHLDDEQSDAENTQHRGDANEIEEGTGKIVFDLVRPLLDKGHTLVMDNFYNSPLLSRLLKSRRTDVMGTLRLNRTFVPESLKSKTKNNMRPGECAFSQTEDLTVVVWRDTNLVSLISTYQPVAVGGRTKYGTYKYKPQVVLDYNKSMGGVDKKDQLLQAFPIERVRNMVWYKKYFRHIINSSILNSFIIYQSAHPKITQRAFRVMLVDEILNRFAPRIPKIVAGLGHYPQKILTSKPRCKNCSLKRIRTTATFECEACKVSLCIIGCFKEWHERIRVV